MAAMHSCRVTSVCQLWSSLLTEEPLLSHRGFEAWEICLITALTLWLLHRLLSSWRAKCAILSIPHGGGSGGDFLITKYIIPEELPLHFAHFPRFSPSD